MPLLENWGRSACRSGDNDKDGNWRKRMATGGEECEWEENAGAEGGAVRMAQAAGTRVPSPGGEECEREEDAVRMA